jgi:nitroreductase
MMLAIHALGYGSTWIGHFDANALEKQFPEMEDYELIALLPVGVMAEDCKPSERHTISKNREELVKIL